MTLEQLIELERKASPARWIEDTYNTVFAGSEKTHDLVEICTIPDEPETGDSRKRTREEWYPESAINRQLIPALRNAAPAYFEVVQAAKEYVANCKGVVNAICEDGMVRSYFDVDECEWVMVPCQCAALRSALAKLEDK